MLVGVKGLKAQVGAKACDKAILVYQDMDYETRLRALGLVSLEERRRVKNLVTCYKYISGLVTWPLIVFHLLIVVKTRFRS